MHKDQTASHSSYPRRQLFKASGAAIAGLSLSTILMDDELASAQAQTLNEVSASTKSSGTVQAYIALPAVIPAPAIILIHEWWGLNDQIKAVAAEYAKLGYVALAIDLMKGDVAKTPDQARAQTQAVKFDEGIDTMHTWVDWLREHKAVNGKIGTVGWCFGGGWSLNASIAAPIDATVIYYGRVNKPLSDLAKLKGPVLGHFATKDKFINQEMVGGFEENLKAAQKPATIHWYDADHAFANPTGRNYDSDDAKLSWQRTVDFFKKNL